MAENNVPVGPVLVAWCIAVGISLAIWAGIIYAAVHFIGKFW